MVFASNGKQIRKEFKECILLKEKLERERDFDQATSDAHISECTAYLNHQII